LTEVPDYLLQRSRQRRAALGLGGDDTGDGGGEVDTSAGGPPAAAATPGGGDAAPSGKVPVPVTPGADPEPAPRPPNVDAALRRKRIPAWAMPVLLLLPIWAWVYALTLDPASTGEESILDIGEAGYGACAACHGAGGDGGTGPAFADGAVLETFPTINDHVRWVALGSSGWQAEVGDVYGADEKPVGGSGNVMPAFASLAPEELLAVVIHERVAFGGEDPVEAGFVDEEGNLLLEIDEEGNVVDLEGNVMADGTESAAAEG
jgi:mono/diheme cytochrome c family protein